MNRALQRVSVRLWDANEKSTLGRRVAARLRHFSRSCSRLVAVCLLTLLGTRTNLSDCTLDRTGKRAGNRRIRIERSNQGRGVGTQMYEVCASLRLPDPLDNE